jgi:hypothetical protein
MTSALQQKREPVLSEGHFVAGDEISHEGGHKFGSSKLSTLCKATTLPHHGYAGTISEGFMGLSPGARL